MLRQVEVGYGYDKAVRSAVAEEALIYGRLGQYLPHCIMVALWSLWVMMAAIN